MPSLCRGLVALCMRKEVEGADARPDVAQLFRCDWLRTYAEDGSDEERCARIKAFIDEQLGES